MPSKPNPEPYEPTDAEVEGTIQGEDRERYDKPDGPASRRKTIFAFHKKRLIQARRQEQEKLESHLERKGKALDLAERLRQDPKNTYPLPSKDATDEELFKWLDDANKPAPHVPFETGSVGPSTGAASQRKPLAKQPDPDDVADAEADEQRYQHKTRLISFLKALSPVRSTLEKLVGWEGFSFIFFLPLTLWLVDKKKFGVAQVFLILAALALCLKGLLASQRYLPKGLWRRLGRVASFIVAVAFFWALSAYVTSEKAKDLTVGPAPVIKSEEKVKEEMDLYGTIEWFAIGRLPQERPTTFIALLVEVRNNGAPSIAEDWWLTVTPPNSEALIGHPMRIPPNGVTLHRDRGKPKTFSGADALYEKTYRDQIKKGVPVRGILVFTLPSVPPSLVDQTGTVLTLRFKDGSGKWVNATKLVNKDYTAPDDAVPYFPGLDPNPPRPEKR